MIFSLVSPILAGALLFAAATFAGMLPVARMIRIHEARHELKRGSYGYATSIAGWSLIAFWLMATWFVATIIGDWHASGDLNGALERSALRLMVLIEIAGALARSD